MTSARRLCAARDGGAATPSSPSCGGAPRNGARRTAHGVVWGAFPNCGQNCAATERVYVEAAIAEPFKAMMAGGPPP